MGDPRQERPETILVVDDTPEVVSVVTAILRSAAFRVLSAGSGPQAVRLAGETAGKIDLLLSDVDMPGMSGPDLGQILKKERPAMHVMLMSAGDGTTGNLLVLNYGWAFIAKPFVRAKLIEMVNDVLHTPDRSQPGGNRFDSRKDGDGKPPEQENINSAS